MKRRLGRLESALIAYAQMRKLRELRTGDLLKPLRITPKQERELYSRLARAGMIAKVRRGLYLIPGELPLGGSWTPDEGLALGTLMADRQGRYQICGRIPRTGPGDPGNDTPRRAGHHAGHSADRRRVGRVEPAATLNY